MESRLNSTCEKIQISPGSLATSTRVLPTGAAGACRPTSDVVRGYRRMRHSGEVEDRGIRTTARGNQRDRPIAIFGQFMSQNRCGYGDAKNPMRGIEVGNPSISQGVDCGRASAGAKIPRVDEL